MKELIKKYRISILGAILGAIGGYFYYLYVGCASGTCPITSNPYASILWGAIMGYLIFDLFQGKKKENKDEKNNEE